MKKIFALALAIVMMMAIALPAFADVNTDDTGFSTDDGTHQYGDATSATSAAPENTTIADDTMLIKYGVNQEYLVVIPADVSFGFIDPDDDLFKESRTVEAANIVISGNEFFVMSVSSDKQWKLVDMDANKSTPVDYNVTLDNPLDYKTVGVDDDATTVTYDNGNYAAKQAILVIDPAEGNVSWQNKAEGDVTLNFTTRGTAQEGTYLDTLTFHVDIVEEDPRS